MRLLRLDKIRPCNNKERHQLNTGEAKLLSDASTAWVWAEQAGNSKSCGSCRGLHAKAKKPTPPVQSLRFSTGAHACLRFLVEFRTSGRIAACGIWPFRHEHQYCYSALMGNKEKSKHNKEVM